MTLEEFTTHWNSMSEVDKKNYAFYLRRKVDKLERANSDMSWQLNPDRMGGSFTQQEINDYAAWR